MRDQDYTYDQNIFNEQAFDYLSVVFRLKISGKKTSIYRKLQTGSRKPVH